MAIGRANVNIIITIDIADEKVTIIAIVLEKKQNRILNVDRLIELLRKVYRKENLKDV